MNLFSHSLGKGGAIALSAMVLIAGSFIATSGDVAYNSQSLIAAVFSSFSSGPSIVISRNPNSPSGTIIPGRSQALAVFDVVPKNFSEPGNIESTPLQVVVTARDTALSFKDFMLTYQLCVPKGNIYAYGYKYGYAGTYCRSLTAAPSSVSLTGGVYALTFTESFPIRPDQTSSTLTINATAYYSANPALQKQVSVRAQVKSGVAAKSFQCRVIAYGYQNRYGYRRCELISVSANTSLAYGNWLPVSRTYGYGTTSGAGSLAVSTDASSPAYQLVAAGATDIVVGAFRFHAAGENVNLQKVGLRLASGTPMDLMKASLYDGSVKVGEAFFIGTATTAVSTLTQGVQIPKDFDKTLTVKADFSPIGIGQAVTRSGNFVRIDYASADGTGASSASFIAGTGSAPTAGVRIMKSYPSLALVLGLPTIGVADGRLMRFSVSASPSGPIGLKQFSFKIYATNATLANAGIYGFTDSGYSTPVSGQSLDGRIGALASPANGTAFSVKTPTDPLQIPAGATRYFELRASVSGITSGASVTTALLGDASPAASMSPGSLNSFLWSPNSTTTAGLSANDWANGFGVPGLPAGGLTFTRSDSTLPQPATQCADGIDNDGNGRIDYPADSGCSSPSDTTESSSLGCANPPVITGAGGTVGVPYRYDVGSNGVTIYGAPVPPLPAGLTANGNFVEGTPTIAGSFSSQMYANNSCGAILFKITIAAGSASASFSATPTSGTMPLSVTFTGNAGSGCNGGNFTLSYGDGQSDDIAVPADACSTAANSFTKKHTYTNPGTYTATFSPAKGSAFSKVITVKAAFISTECSDGIDNDGNGAIDYPADPGCFSASDTKELSPSNPGGGLKGNDTNLP